jgi:spore germination protein GerM
MRGRLPLAGIGLLAGLLSGCSIGAQGSPQLIEKSSVPFGLLKSSPQATAPASATVLVTVYFEVAHHLVTVDRAVPAPGTLRAVLAALGRGPTSAEATANLESPISTATPIVLKGVDGGTAVVDVPASFSALSGQGQILAAAQLVYTLTQFPGVERVSILVGGLQAQVPTASGRIRSGPLDRAAYATLAPL